MFLGNFLRGQPDLRALLALVVEAVDGLTVFGLTDRAHILFQALVGEHARRLRRRCRRSGQ